MVRLRASAVPGRRTRVEQSRREVEQAPPATHTHLRVEAAAQGGLDGPGVARVLVHVVQRPLAASAVRVAHGGGEAAAAAAAAAAASPAAATGCRGSRRVAGGDEAQVGQQLGVLPPSRIDGLRRVGEAPEAAASLPAPALHSLACPLTSTPRHHPPHTHKQ